jgi:opacity protein-like surface antigen
MKTQLTVFLASLMACTAFAQSGSGVSTSMKKRDAGFSQEGFQIGAEYMNISELRVKIGSDDRSESGHLGMAGVRIGYNHTPDTGIGFNAGASFLQRINHSEAVDNFSFFIPSVNLTYGFHKYVTGFAGPNVAFLNEPSEAKEFFKPDLGLQAGLGFRFTENIALNAGYLVIGQRVRATVYHNGEQISDDEGHVYYSGFNSSLVYTF